MAYLVERIEKCLRAWEDLWFLVEAGSRAMIALGKPPVMDLREPVLQNAPKFRKKLLKNRQNPVNILDFLPSKLWDQTIYALPNFASQIAPWCMHSRRLYFIREDLQAVLNATSLDGVTWEDIYFPFPSFVVCLQKPLKDKSSNDYDLVMVTTTNHEQIGGHEIPVIDFTYIGKACDSYQPLSFANRENIRYRMEKGQWEHTRQLVLGFMKKIDSPHKPFVRSFFFGFTSESRALEVMSTAQMISDNVKKDQGSLWADDVELNNSAVRVIAGMCLYLKTLPFGSPHQSEWRPVPRSGLPDPRAISNEAQVCTVSSCYKLTTEERVVLGLEGTIEQRASYELSCHFRQGHWRRAPGLGHDPNAPKTVHVRPCIVRKDRLREGELPGGSQAIV